MIANLLFCLVMFLLGLFTLHDIDYSDFPILSGFVLGVTIFSACMVLLFSYLAYQYWDSRK